MENEIEPCKFPRLGNVINNSMNKNNIGSGRRKNVVGGSDFQSSWQQQHQQQNSSRIVRVSRASGGKDRHSKVMTSKGLRDRRVRLSVTTAIQFYDIQDRLGYDQPSKAVDWLIKAASDSISELPSLDTTFTQTDPKQPSYENQSENQNQKQKHNIDNNNFCLSKSGCSSTSETSKENECSIIVQEQKHHQNMSQTASFTELLTGGIGGSSTVTSNNGAVHDQIHRHGGFLGQIQLGHSSHSHSHQVSPFSGENENNSDITQLQHFPFMSSSSDQHNENHDDYNLNFTISSSGLVGYNRGTLQSNSLLPHFQRFSPVMDHGSSTSSSSNNLPFFMGGSAAPPVATPTMDQQHLQFSPLFDARLQLFYGDGSRHSDQKEKCNKD
ncbi:unnamed protein product [Trifolium pratense]|uniref:Uncharacterized protein n=1 Tax=Trifolium pratense TaxID=57577 RepID=A0ACB0KN79_TRIPR|nr:unnamed protein product [Trifolium pratense]